MGVQGEEVEEDSVFGGEEEDSVLVVAGVDFVVEEVEVGVALEAGGEDEGEVGVVQYGDAFVYEELDSVD